MFGSLFGFKQNSPKQDSPKQDDSKESLEDRVKNLEQRVTDLEKPKTTGASNLLEKPKTTGASNLLENLNGSSDSSSSGLGEPSGVLSGPSSGMGGILGSNKKGGKKSKYGTKKRKRSKGKQTRGC